jgi:hypothetical protein
MNEEMLSIFAQISACNAKIAAMQALNSARLQEGMTPGYDEHDFWEEVVVLEKLSCEAKSLKSC